MQQPQPPITPLRRRAPSASSTPLQSMTLTASPARATRSHDKHSAGDVQLSASATAAEDSSASNQKENQTRDSNANAQHSAQHSNKQTRDSAHVPAMAAAASSSSAGVITPRSASRKKKHARVIVPDFLGPATPSKSLDTLPFHVAAAAAAAADHAAQQRLMLQQFSNGSNLGAGLSLEEEFNMVATSSGLAAAEDLNLLSDHSQLAPFHSPQRPLAYTPLRTPLHPVTAFTNNAHAAAATSASVASNAAASSSTTVPAPAAPSLRSKQKLSFVAPASSASGAAAAATAAPFKIALPDTYLKVLAGATNAFASSYPSAARAARASAAAAAAASSSSASPPAVSASSILSPTTPSASSASTWSNFNFALHSFTSTTSQPNQSEACNQLFASSANSALPDTAAAASSVPAASRPLDEAQLKELVQQSLQQAGIESDVDSTDDDEADARMYDAASAAQPASAELFGAPLPYAPESFNGSMVQVARKNRVTPALFVTPQRATQAPPAASASEPQLQFQPLASPAFNSVPSAPFSAPIPRVKKIGRPRKVTLPGFPLPLAAAPAGAVVAVAAEVAPRPPKPESLKLKRRKGPQFVNHAVQLVVDVHQAREKTDTMEAGMGLEMLTKGPLSPSAPSPVAPSPTTAGNLDLSTAASLYPMGFRARPSAVPVDVPGYLTAVQRTELRCQLQLHMQLLYQTHWMCSVLPTPPAKAGLRDPATPKISTHAELASTSRTLIEQMVDAAQGTSTTSVAPAAPSDPSPALEASTQSEADEHAEQLMLLASASSASPSSPKSSGADDEPSSKAASAPAISLAAVGPYISNTPFALPAAAHPLKVLQVPAMSLWPREDSLRNLSFPVGPEAELRKMQLIEEAAEAEKKPQSKDAPAGGDKDEVMADSAMEMDAATAPDTPKASSAAAASAALSTLSASKRSTSAASASPADPKKPRLLHMLPQSIVQSFWVPFLYRASPDAVAAAPAAPLSPAASASASAAAPASAVASSKPPNCYALDVRFFVRYPRNERHTFSTSEDHLWKLGLAAQSWDSLKAKLAANNNFQDALDAAVQTVMTAYTNATGARKSADPARYKLAAMLSAEPSTLELLTLIRRRFLPGKTLDQLQTKFIQHLVQEKKHAMTMQPRMISVPQTAAAGKGKGKGKAKAAAATTALPRAFRPMPSQIAAAVEQDAAPLEGFVIRRTPEEAESAAAAPAESAAVPASSSPFAPVETLRDLTSTELLVVTKGLQLHGAHRNKWAVISTQMLPYFPRKLLAKAWTKHQDRLKGKKTKPAAAAAAAAASQPDSPSSEATAPKPKRASGGKKRKAANSEEGAIFDTMDLSAAPAQATPAERRRLEGAFDDAASPADEFDTMEIEEDSDKQGADEAAARTESRSAAVLLSPQQPHSNQAAIKTPVGFTPAKPDQTSNQLAA